MAASPEALRQVSASGEAEAYYTENYPDYAAQNPPRKLAFYRSLLQRYVRPGARLFELGVGLGLFLESVCGEYDCAGCDVNTFGIEQTRRRTGVERLHVGSLETLNAEPASDAVVSWDVLEHLPDLDGALRSLHAHLAAGGYLIGVVPVYDGPLGWLVHLLDKDRTHVTKQSRHFWLRKLREAGFEIVEWGGILRKLVGSYYVHLTGPQWLLRPVGSAIYFVARKPAGNTESFLVSESPVFKRIIRRSRASYKRSGGLTREQLEERLAKTRDT